MSGFDTAMLVAVVALANVVVELGKLLVGKLSGKKNGCGLLTRDQQNKLETIFTILSEKDDDKVHYCYTPRSYGATLKDIEKSINTNTAVLRDMQGTLSRIEGKIK